MGLRPLDLVTPLQQGEQLGQEAAYRRAQIADDIAKTQNMRQALGLQEQAQAFQQSMWTSQAGMRAAQMDLTQAQADSAVQSYQTTAAGQPVLNDFLSKLNTTSDPDALNNMTIPPGLSAQQQDQATAAVVQARQGLGARIAADTASSQNLTNTSMVSDAVKAGIDVRGYTDPTGGVNYPALGAALNQHELSMKKTEAENSASTMAAQMRFQASMYGASSRNQSRNYVADRTASQRYLSGLQSDYSQLQKSGTITPDQNSYYQGEIQKAQAGFAPMPDGAQPAGAAPNSPMAPQPTNNASAINSLLQRSFSAPSSGTSGPAPGTSSTIQGSFTSPGGN